MTDRVYLAVPYAERAEAKAQGCRWDVASKKWYVTPAAKTYGAVCSRWAEKPPISILVGEIRPFGVPELAPEPAPPSCKSLRGLVDASTWERLKQMARARAGNICEYCSATGTMYTHDKYEYSAESQTRRLVRILAVCDNCREALCACRYPARTTGLSPAALGQLIRVRGWSVEQASQSYTDALAALDEKLAWSTDLSILEQSGLKILG